MRSGSRRSSRRRWRTSATTSPTTARSIRCFGTLADFDALLAAAHARGLRVILDWVPNHTSEQHAWFRESRASRASAKRAWYVWRDPAPGGGPPNNWVSVFGGPAWTLDPATGQYYLHSFLKEQPDLDWRNPAVRDAMHGVLRFWLERGVDGFRIDVVHRLAKDPALRDNPLLPGRAGQGYGSQQHVHDENHPDVHELLRGIRRVLDAYPERMAVGEVYLMDPSKVARYYGRGDELQLAFNFSFLNAPWSAAAFRGEAERFLALVPESGWPDQVLSSHDAVRHASRYDHPRWGDERARLAALMLLTLRGTPFLYQGEEIGMRQVAVPPERMRDPLARTLHPSLSRDGCRTPMQWEAGPGAGFSAGEPWLPIGDCARYNVAAQRTDPSSLLHLYRALIALRRAHPALARGEQRSLPAPDAVWAFERSLGGERFAIALNFGEEPATCALGEGAPAGGLRTRAGAALPASLARVELAPCEGAVLRAAR